MKKKDPFPEFNMKKCRRCGKMFIPAAMHVYKTCKAKSTTYYCSWTCYLHSEDKETKLK